MTTEKKDDLEAVRNVVEALKDFLPEEQERIIRWSREKLGLAGSEAVQKEHRFVGRELAVTPDQRAEGLKIRDIRSFVAEKDPKTDSQFAAVVAYYYAFEAPEGQKKDSIASTDLQDACRQAGRERLTKPIMTLHNAANAGLLDKAGEPGSFKLNTVGENLVAMTLPEKGTGKLPMRRSPKSKKSARKKHSSRKVN